jgi:hypothetical protein
VLCYWLVDIDMCFACEQCEASERLKANCILPEHPVFTIFLSLPFQRNQGLWLPVPRGSGRGTLLGSIVKIIMILILCKDFFETVCVLNYEL